MLLRFTRCVVVGILIAWSQASTAADAKTLNALFGQVLRAHVDEGYVDYPAVSRNVRFHKYLEAIASLDPDTLDSREVSIAFWLNVYNALVIKQIVDGQTPIGPIAKIRFFRTTEHPVAGRNLDLQSIADDILFEFEEPRVHFAMVNSTYSAPRLRSEAYRADELERQLESNTRDFLNDNRKNRYSVALRRAKLATVFEEYEDEFGGSKKAVLDFIVPYLEEEAVVESIRDDRWDVEYMKYDWSINGRPM